MRRRQPAVFLPALFAAVLGVAGCNGAVASIVAAEDPPASVETVQGDEAPRIMLSKKAILRLGVQTKPVVAAPAGSSRRPMLIIPYSAVVYDVNGAAWAFTSPAPRTFVRAPLVIASIEGDSVTLTSGPPPGTAMVTVAASELVGVEAGISGEE